jgi:uncharacterized Zn finger protein
MAKKTKPTQRPISVDAIRSLATPESFLRGRQYFKDGAVSRLVRRGAEISAEVEGSEIDPYEVTIRLHGGGVAEARCSCPYDWGGFCKHIVAALLKLGESPADVVERPAIAELLAGLDKDELIALLSRRLKADPALAKWIEAELATSVVSDAADDERGTGSSARRTVVDQIPVRELAETLIRGRYRRRRYWDDYRATGSEEELHRLVEKAVPFLEAGDGRNALRVLDPIAETFVTGWLEEAYATDEEMYLLFDDIARMMAEAVLMSDLSADERDDLAETVEGWHQRLEDYGAGEGFPIVLRALETGWEEPALQAVLAGKARSWPPSGRADRIEATLTEVRLRVLEACDRTEEYLRFASAAGRHACHATMLVKLGRADEAVACAKKRFKTPSQAHDLAKALREAGDDARALETGEAGLWLVGDHPENKAALAYAISNEGPHGLSALAHWLRDYAGALGKKSLALKAATVAFEQTHSLEDFRAAETWAGAKAWAKVRADLLAHLASTEHAHDRTLIYLEERLIDEAVRSAGKPTEYNSDAETLMRLAHAAHASHPDWVISFAGAKAAAIMDNNRAQHYQEAADWLEKVALAYDAAGREGEWARLIDGLIDKHRRKYKLRPLLETLR